MMVTNARTANPDMRNCWLDFMGEQGWSVRLPHTRMAYIPSYISHSLNICVSVDTRSIAEQDGQSTTPSTLCGERFVRYIPVVTYLDGRNDAQRRAVLATLGPVSVLAGAGSGKTRVLTTRVYHLVRQGVAPASILAVTFTNKAAREMRERLRTMLGADAPTLPFVATFHGLGRELLERYGRVMGVPRFFSVYDRDDSEKLVAQALKALDVEAKELSPRAVLGRISKAKGQGMTVAEFAERQSRSSFGN